MRWNIGKKEIISDGGPLNILKECGYGFYLGKVDLREVIKDKGLWWGLNMDSWS